MGTEDTIDLIAIALIVSVIAFIIYEVFAGGVGQSISATWKSTQADPSQPASTGSLFWGGVNNFFSTGSIYDSGS
jgi:hypothetical protein